MSKQCHCLQFAKCIAGLLHYYTCKKTSIFTKMQNYLLVSFLPPKCDLATEQYLLQNQDCSPAYFFSHCSDLATGKLCFQFLILGTLSKANHLYCATNKIFLCIAIEPLTAWILNCDKIQQFGESCQVMSLLTSASFWQKLLMKTRRKRLSVYSLLHKVQ